jgi:hypothetical protein
MKLALFIAAARALVATAENSAADAFGLVQKSLSITGPALNHTARTEVASELLVKLSGLVHMIDHDLAKGEDGDELLEQLFECTRGAGLPTADLIIGLTHGIASMRGNCKEQPDGKSRRACAKDITGFLGDTLGLIMILPGLPGTCFMQDCSAKDNFNNKVAPVMAAAGGVETLLGLMTAIGNVDASCISKETTSIAGNDDKHLKYPTWLYWVLKPFDLLSNAYSVGILAASKESQDYHYQICADIAGFTGSALGLMEALFDAKSHEEGVTMGEAGQSAQWGCASGLTKLVSTLPGTIGIACSYESCKDGEQVAEAKKANFA